MLTGTALVVYPEYQQSVKKIYTKTTYRINVGARPRKNTPSPSARYELAAVEIVVRYGEPWS